VIAVRVFASRSGVNVNMQAFITALIATNRISSSAQIIVTQENK